MPTGPTSTSTRSAELLRRVLLERERALRAGDIAERHERAAMASFAPVHELNMRMSHIHRRIEWRHFIVSQLYGSIALTDQRPRSEQRDLLASRSSLMAATAELTGSDGAIMALFGSDIAEALVLASDDRAIRAHELELQTCEGPSRDAFHIRLPVTAAGQDLRQRWQLFGPEAASLDIREVVAMPLKLGKACLGALTLLNPGSAASASAMTDVLGEALVLSLLDECLIDSDNILPVEGDHRPAMHEASGRLSVRLGCSVADALALIRARAYADGRAIDAVARGILLHQESFS